MRTHTFICAILAAICADGCAGNQKMGCGCGTRAGGPATDPSSGGNGSSQRPTAPVTIKINRATALGNLHPGLATFSFEKTHLTDGFFSASHTPLIAMFKLLGSAVVRIGANDVDSSVWQPNAAPNPGGITSNNVGTVEVDALGEFLNATGWKAIYGVAMKSSTPEAAVPEATYVATKLGSNLAALEIGNEINFFPGGIAVTRPRWETFADAIHAASPNLPLAAPATAGDINFTKLFAATEASRMVLLTHHYYRGGAESNPTLGNLLPIDGTVASYSQQLASVASANKIRDGWRWGEINSFFHHGADGVSNVFGAALWGIDFMLTTAQYGAAGVHFHGGGQNEDGNVCKNGITSCTKPFRYSPLIEVDGRVTAAAPLYYGMLFVSRMGTGSMLATSTSAGLLNFTAYAVSLADGSTNVAIVNKDATSGVNASVDVGVEVGAANAIYLQAPSLASKTAITLAGSEVSAAGAWNPLPPTPLSAQGNVVTVVVPPASAILVHAK